MSAEHRTDIGSLKVLYVDDDPGLLDLTKTYLERSRPIRVETQPTAESALSRLEAESFDGVLSDYQMPDLDGLEFLDRIRNTLELNIPFIIFTGRGREEVAIDALNLGANRYLQKGGDPKTQFDILADAIEQEVKHHRAELRAQEYQERLELAQEIANFGIIDWDLTTGEVICSDELCRMFGLPEDEPLTMEDIEATMHPDDREMIQAELEAAIAGEKQYSLTHRNVRPDGTVLWTKNQAILIRNERGDPVRLVGISCDVTDIERQASCDE